jgi:hypothetical protein
MTFSITKLCIMTFSITVNKTRQNNDIEQNGKVYSCLLYAECRYAECHSAECHYAECRGADGAPDY